MSASNALSARLIGAIFLERGLVTADQLKAALAMQKETKEHLGEILVQHFGVSRIELASVLAEQWADLERANAGPAGAGGGAVPQAPPVQLVEPVDDAPDVEPVDDEEEVERERRPLGEILVEQALVTDDELDRALQAQRESGEKLGEILVSQGSITRLQLASALADQWTALRKIRPPSSPRASRPHPAGAPADASSADVDRLREAVAALEQRLRAAESLAAREPWREEINTATDGLQQTVAALEGRLDAVETRDEPEALAEVRTTLDELAGRVETLADSGPAVDKDVLRRVESAAEAAEAARSGLGGAFESLSLRLSDVEARVHDRSDIAELKAELEALAQRLPEPGAEERGSSDLDALRDEVQRLLDEVHRRSEAPAGDAKLAERVEALAGQVDELAGTVRGAEGGKKSSAEVKVLKEALASLGASVQELATDSKLGLEDLRGVVAELQARPAESDLAERLSRYGAGSDHIDELKERLSEVEGRLAELAQLRGAVEELAARPVGDPILAERVDVLARELEESSGLPGRLEALRSQVEELAAAVGDVAEVRRTVETFAERAWAPAEDVSDLRSEVSALGSRFDAFARHSTEVATYEQVEDLAARLRELEAVSSHEEVVELRRELSALGQRLDLLAESPSQAILPEQIEALETRLASLAEATASKDELERFAGRIDTVEDTGAGLDELRRELEALSATIGAPSEDLSRLRAEVAALGRRLDALADRASDAVPPERFEDLSSRVGSELDRLRRTLDELNGRPVADAELVEALSRRVEELAGSTGDVDELRRGLETVSRKLGAPAEDMVEVRAEVAALGQLLDALAERVAKTDPAARLGELTSRLAALEEAATATSELDELRRRLDTLSQQVGAPSEDVSELRAELAALRERLDGFAERSTEAESTGQLDELSSRLAALEEAVAAPKATDELDEIRRELAVLSEQAGAPAEDVAHLRTELAALALRLDTIPDHTGSDPELTDRVEQLASEVAAIARAAEAERSQATSRAETVADDLRAEVERLAERVSAVQELAATESTDEHDSRIESLEQRLAERESLDAALGARIDEVSDRLGAADELRARLDGVVERVDTQEAGRAESVAKSELTKLRRDVKEKLGDLEQRVDGLAASTAEGQESVVHGLEEAVAGVQAELRTQRTEVGDRVDETAREAASLREQLAELREVAGERIEAQARAEADLLRRMEELAGALESGAGAHADLTAALAEVRAELSMLTARVDAPDTATTDAVEAMQAELAEVVDFVRSAQLNTEPDEELRFRIDDLERRLETESVSVEDEAEQVDEVQTAEETPVPEEELTGAFLAFVPNDHGYSLQEILGAPPAVGEPMAVANGDDEFVVTRIGRSPLPLDHRRCAYLELAVLGNPSDRVT